MDCATLTTKVSMPGDIPNFETQSLTGGQIALPSGVAHYISRLLRRNLDRLHPNPELKQKLAEHPLNNLDAVFNAHYSSVEQVHRVVPELNRLALIHQRLSSQSSIHRQELAKIESEIFEWLGFKHLSPFLDGKILLVDDTPENLRLLSSTLKRKGYDVRSSINGRMALSVIHNIMPDLVLLDIMMPGLDGYEVCKRLKQDERTRDIPIIFISAISDVLDKVKAFQAGGVDYITKPFQIEEVLVRVENQMRLRNLQKRLEEQNIRLQQEICDRRRAEEQALEALIKEKEFSELKSRFVSTISHEFRTPLTMIQSSSELLEYYDCSETERLERLHQIQSAVQHMTNLLEDVLLMGQTEAQKLRLYPSRFNLTEVCQKVVTDIQLTAQPQHRIQLIDRNPKQEVYLDQKLLRQILYNLLSNAIKYSPKGGDVELILSHQDAFVVLQVRDRGIGIPKADQVKLFESFHRASNVGTTPGTGLGLAIVKKCVDLQQGFIFVESEIDVGTTFTVKLPIDSP